jgi:hypothetical protein
MSVQRVLRLEQNDVVDLWERKIYDTQFVITSTSATDDLTS